MSTQRLRDLMEQAGITVSFVRLHRDPNDWESPVEFSITVQGSGQHFTIPEFSWGIGYVKGYKSGFMSVYDAERLLREIPKFKPIPEDVIGHVLAFDSAADSTFEEWCFELGADTDSIKEKNNFESYREWALLLRRMFGGLHSDAVMHEDHDDSEVGE